MDTIAEPVVTARLRDASHDPGAVLLEGVHAVKHALRFGAGIELIATDDRDRALALFADLAPDVLAQVAGRLTVVGSRSALEAGGRPVPTGVVAVAARPATPPPAAGGAPLVVLDGPRSLANVGAVVRMAAAADAGGVLCCGDADPWHPAAVRGAAGLQFALPVWRGTVDEIAGAPVLGFDAGGEPLDPAALPSGAALVFGAERSGIGAAARARCDRLVALPMRPGVSSLNLATAAAAVLMSWRLATGWRPGP